jgi:hypothetical protein
MVNDKISFKNMGKRVRQITYRLFFKKKEEEITINNFVAFTKLVVKTTSRKDNFNTT